MEFSVEELIKDDTVRYVVSGYVNESAKFPPLKIAPVVWIDLGRVEGLNSIGTRAWCDWVGQMKPPGSLLVEKCPPIFIKSFNNVVGALTSNMHVVSFYIPFVSASGVRTDLLFTKEQIMQRGQLQIPEGRNESGEVLEMDVLNNYFGFLQR